VVEPGLPSYGGNGRALASPAVEMEFSAVAFGRSDELQLAAVQLRVGLGMEARVSAEPRSARLRPGDAGWWCLKAKG